MATGTDVLIGGTEHAFFSAPVTYGFYDSGEAWVLKHPTIKLTGFTHSGAPVNGTWADGSAYTARAMHGVMINPGNSAAMYGGSGDAGYAKNFGPDNGYDSGQHNSTSVGFAPLYDKDPGYTGIPIAIDTAKTIMKAVSNVTATSSRTVLDWKYALTIVDAVPPPRAFRPGAAATVKNHRYTAVGAEAFIATLPSFARSTIPPGGTAAIRVTPLSTVLNTAKVNCSLPIQFERIDALNARGMGAQQQQDTYGQDQAFAMEKLMLSLCLDYVASDKLTIFTRLMRVAIDLMERFKEGGVCYDQGGNLIGYGPVIALAAKFFNDADFLFYADRANGKYPLEARQTYTVTQAMIDRSNPAFDIDYIYMGTTGLFQGQIADAIAGKPGAGTYTPGKCGTGYKVGDIISDPQTSGLGAPAFQATVTGIDALGGVIKFKFVAAPKYYAHPTYPVSVATTGSGTGFVYTQHRPYIYGGQNMLGDSEWGSSPTASGGVNLAGNFDIAYRNLVGGSTLGVWLAATLMDLWPFINDPIQREYYERYFNHQRARPVPSGSGPGDGNGFSLMTYDMWRAFRGTSGLPTTPPVAARVQCKGPLVWIAYDRTMDRQSEPAASSVVVRVNGVARSVINAPTVYGRSFNLEIATPAVSGDVVTLDYTQPSTGLRLRDLAGNLAPNLTGYAVENLAGGTPPTPVASFSAQISSGPYYVDQPITITVAPSMAVAACNIVGSADDAGNWTPSNTAACPAGTAGVSLTFTPTTVNDYVLELANDGGYQEPQLILFTVTDTETWTRGDPLFTEAGGKRFEFQKVAYKARVAIIGPAVWDGYIEPNSANPRFVTGIVKGRNKPTVGTDLVFNVIQYTDDAVPRTLTDSFTRKVIA